MLKRLFKWLRPVRLAGWFMLLSLTSPAGAAPQIITWGNNSFGQTNVPPGLTNVLGIAAGFHHALALSSDGTVTAWGDDGSGQCNVPAGLSNVIAVAGGKLHSLALKADGTAAAWGDNSFGQTNLPAGLSNVVALAAGQYHNLALHADGTVSAWGDNSSGQLDRPAGLSNVVAIAGGDAYSLALKADGTMVAWGDNASGQTNVPAGLNNVVAIAAGGSHSLALKANGWIAAWGSQDFVPGNSANHGAAIISSSPGSASTHITKTNAQEGNVVVNGAAESFTIVDGSGGYGILANGGVNMDQAGVSVSSVSMMNWGTAEQIPDYATQGTSNSLFNLARLIAVADVAGTHYTNLNTFIRSNNVASSNDAIGALEGVIVVDIRKSDSRYNDLTPSDMPRGINIRGTLVFNFATNFTADDKLINTATININRANLTGLNPADPSTFTTGYPPTYLDPAKEPSNVDITSKGFVNFGPSDELPALLYNIVILDIHGNANVCGAVVSPSFVEIENKWAGQTQYFRGPVIGGSGGVYVENLPSNSLSIISVEPQSIGIAACFSNNLARKANGRAAAWGSGTSVPAGLSNVVAIAAGVSHGLALTGDDVPPLRSRLTSARVNGHRFSVSVPTQTGRVYALEYKDSLSDSNWTPLPLAAGNGTLLTLTDDGATGGQRFYRLRQW